jgi:hypothetical protein
MSRRMACTRERIASSWPATFRSNSWSFIATSLLVAIISRSRTKARTTYTLTSTARVVFNTLASMMAPCSVKA